MVCFLDVAAGPEDRLLASSERSLWLRALCWLCLVQIVLDLDETLVCAYSTEGLPAQLHTAACQGGIQWFTLDCAAPDDQVLSGCTAGAPLECTRDVQCKWGRKSGGCRECAGMKLAAAHVLQWDPVGRCHPPVLRPALTRLSLPAVYWPLCNCPPGRGRCAQSAQRHSVPETRAQGLPRVCQPARGGRPLHCRP